MAESLTLYHLPPSPNNIKVRIALGYKGLAYEKVTVNPSDRATVVEVSGQSLTPVLVHEGRVIFDSGAILRYLDANFRSTPPLFSADRETMRSIERWEHFGRGKLVQPIGMAFGEILSGSMDAEAFAKASTLLNEVTARMEDQLAKTAFLVGETLTAADVTAAPWVYYGMVPEAAAAANPFVALFREHVHLGENRDRTRDWVGRVMAWDR